MEVKLAKYFQLNKFICLIKGSSKDGKILKEMNQKYHLPSVPKQKSCMKIRKFLTAGIVTALEGSFEKVDTKFFWMVF